MSSPSSSSKSLHLRNERRARVEARVGREHPVGVGQQHQQLGAEQDRDLGGEEVVVAERDLVGGGRVILVDHRDDAPVEQLAQRLARVQVVACGRSCRRTSAAPARSARRARAAARRRPGRACPARPRSPPGARRSRGAQRRPITPIPRAIAPLVTTTGSRPARAAAASSSQIAAEHVRRGSPRSSATMLDPSLTTRRPMAHRD